MASPHDFFNIVQLSGTEKWTVRAAHSGYPDASEDYGSPAECEAWLDGWAVRDSEEEKPEPPPVYELEVYDPLAKRRAVIDRRHGQPVAWIDYDDVAHDEADGLAYATLAALNEREVSGA